MLKETKPVLFMLVGSGLILLLILIMQPLQILKFWNHIAFLFPSGIIALKERNLLFIIQAIMLIIIIPVYILTFAFSWRYRAQNKNATYDPDLVDNTAAEFVWWGLPLVLTVIIAVITWQKTHELDPFKPIKSDKKPLTIQVIALQWKWLFIYPEEKIASLNFLQFPNETPLHFEITAEAPMNSFWIPRLGGQIYAMPKMKTELYLMADEIGEFRGSSANISGEGFAGMHFIAKSSSEEDYQKWVESTKKSTQSLDLKVYNELAKPSQDNPVELYQLKDEALFNEVLMKYMRPKESNLESKKNIPKADEAV